MNRLHCVRFADEDNIIAAAVEETTISVTIDWPNKTGVHFVGAINNRIDNYGSCTKKLVGSTNTEAECECDMADMSRPLHAVCKLTSEVEKPKQYVPFNTAKRSVVPPSIADRILKHVLQLIQYDREDNLMSASLKVSGFQWRQAK